MTSMTLKPLGDRALLLEIDAPLSIRTQARIWALAERAPSLAGVIETVPGTNNLMVSFDPLDTGSQALAQALERLWRDSEGQPAREGRLVEIPVRYGGVDGPDLGDVARHAGLSEEEVVRRHGEATYVVYCLGFQPGFAYLGGLDPSLATPRRDNPRIAVPAGAVAIAGTQTAVYPAVSPGGWNLIGQTELSLFDPGGSPPTLLQAGDRVRFVASETGR